MSINWSFHHLGIATENLESESIFYQKLNYNEVARFKDDIQGIEGIFLEGPGPRIELLRNLPGSTTLTSSLNEGIKHHHLAYKMSHDTDLDHLGNLLDGFIVSGPHYSQYFRCPIVFIMQRNGQLIEVILDA